MVLPCSDRVSRAPPYSLIINKEVSHTGLSPAMVGLPRPFCYLNTDFWAAPRSLVTTGGISVDFFSSRYLDVSVPRVCFQQLCIHCRIPPKRWVSPFRHLRINACCQLPGAFRRLPRLSSPLTAKASTVCAYSLDHITLSRLKVIRCEYNDYFKFRHSYVPALASRHV